MNCRKRLVCPIVKRETEILSREGNPDERFKLFESENFLYLCLIDDHSPHYTQNIVNNKKCVRTMIDGRRAL